MHLESFAGRRWLAPPYQPLNDPANAKETPKGNFRLIHDVYIPYQTKKPLVGERFFGIQGRERKQRYWLSARGDSGHHFFSAFAFRFSRRTTVAPMMTSAAAAIAAIFHQATLAVAGCCATRPLKQFAGLFPRCGFQSL
ncbi:MAG: hypothetical protein ABFD03_11890 [Clostridiaceae bacterium]